MEAPANVDVTGGMIRLGFSYKSDAYNSERFLKGKLDELRIYNRALSEAEIQELSKSGLTNQFEGYLDAADCESIRGWAWDSTQPNSAICSGTLLNSSTL